MSTTCKVDLPNLADIPAMPLVEVARHVAALRREQDRLVEEDTDSSHELADQLGDLLWDIDDQVLARSPSTVADAAVMLLAIASSLRPAMDSLDNRSTMMDAWLGAGACHQVPCRCWQGRPRRDRIGLLGQQHHRPGPDAAWRRSGGSSASCRTVER